MSPRRLLGPGLAAVLLILTACGGSATTSTTDHRTASRTPGAVAGSHPRPAPPKPAYPRLLAAGTVLTPTNFVPAVTWRGQNAAWVARRPELALLSLDQHLVELHLHSGTIDAGTTGWRWGPDIAGSERRSVVAAFNGGFKLSVGAGGFESYGRVASPLQPGLGSIVTYSDGYTDIGAWNQAASGVPAQGKRVVSVRQNLHLLIDGGHPTGTTGCVVCWGATLGGVLDPARSALGITADGHLIWVGGEHLTVAALSDALLGARVVRAVELDINPEWVAAYLYGHRAGRGGPAPIPQQVTPGQPGVPGQFLVPYQRDFFVATAR